MKENKKYFSQMADVIVNKFGPDAACVHAVIWNKSKTEGYECKLSEAQIGNEIHISYKRVKKAINTLLQYGYIHLIDPNNEYGTKSYIYIPEMIENGIDPENKATLKCNDARISDPRKNPRKVIKDKKADTNCPTLSSELRDESSHLDDTSHPTKQGFDGTNHTGIKKSFKELNKEIIKENNTSQKTKTTKKDIKEKIENKLTINALGNRWDKFIEFAYQREIEAGESIDKFLDWALNNGFNPLYWTPEKMITFYPRAFSSNNKNGYDDNWLPKSQPFEEEDESKYVPMPDYVKYKRMKLNEDDEERREFVKTEKPVEQANKEQIESIPKNEDNLSNAEYIYKKWRENGIDKVDDVILLEVNLLKDIEYNATQSDNQIITVCIELLETQSNQLYLEFMTEYTKDSLPKTVWEDIFGQMNQNKDKLDLLQERFKKERVLITDKDINFMLNRFEELYKEKNKISKQVMTRIKIGKGGVPLV